ncbi:unnamed protein product [Protopolystoma xenopodis]|uniref:Uncharacterized protein n=1 Tax=Protopolystoma xenopodis TaxID=117903 RepID=A0A3S5AAD6_9PLAT|nr:unnamed protein product [Protopolystoma xenopodis]
MIACTQKFITFRARMVTSVGGTEPYHPVATSLLDNDLPSRQGDSEETQVSIESDGEQAHEQLREHLTRRKKNPFILPQMRPGVEEEEEPAASNNVLEEKNNNHRSFTDPRQELPDNMDINYFQNGHDPGKTLRAEGSYHKTCGTR